MLPTIPLALYGWPVVALVFFAALRPRHAVIATVVLGWLLLPMAGLSMGSGIPSYTKYTAIALGLVLGMGIFGTADFSRIRPHWFDLPIVMWCIAPMFASVTNGLGVNDGILEVYRHVLHWGLPYFVGRMYFSDLEGIRELAIGIFLGGLLYMLLCLFELRMSPQLHNWVYGFHQHKWRQHLRGDGYRPKVFMQHGLAVGFWIAATTVVGAWLWQGRVLRRLWGLPVAWLVGAMVVTMVLCQSVGALVLMVLGLGLLLVMKQRPMRIAVLCLALLPLGYMGARATGLWDGSQLVTAAGLFASERRVNSFNYRLRAEDMLAEHAMRQPVFGWGTWGRNRPARMGWDEERDLATDGLWIIALGQRGLFGLVGVVGVIMLPLILAWWKLPAAAWTAPATAPVAALSVVLGLFMIDCLFNAMLNPVFVLASGGLLGAFAAWDPVKANASEVMTPELATTATPRGVPLHPAIARGRTEGQWR